MSKKNLIFTCDCGCGSGFEFKLLDDLIFVSALNADFYSLQNNLKDMFIDTYKEYYLRKHKKVNIIKEAIITKKDVEKLLKFLEENVVNLTEDTSESKDNYPILYIDKIDLDGGKTYEGEEILFSLEYRSRNKSFKEIFFTKKYRKFDMVLTKKEVNTLIKNCKKVLN